MAVEKALDEQIVLEQSASAAPAQLAQRPLAQWRLAVCADQ
jgi:hypothetical protein